MEELLGDFPLPTTERFLWTWGPANTPPTLTPTLVQNLKDFFANRRQEIFLELTDLPHYSTLKDSEKAAKRVVLALQNKELITIFGDYDVDGTVSCALLKLFFKSLGHEVGVYIPDRLKEGYGLNPVGVTRVAEAGTSLIITVDNGISALEACQKAKAVGVDVIITDHHSIPPVLPQAFAILNPKQEDCHFADPMIAGVGVAFYLMSAIRAELRAQGHPADMNLRSYLDYVALGTIADMAPLTGVNHVFCKIGLQVARENLRQGTRLGLKAILQVAGQDGDTLNETDIGFRVAPRLNAVGRLGTAYKSVEILSTNSWEEALSLANDLDTENSERRQLEAAISEEALLQAQESYRGHDALVLHAPHWHTGVVGIVASRVLDKFYRPTLVLGTLDGKIKGSGRSTHSFDLFNALNSVRDEFLAFGGHYHAVGLTMDAGKLPWLRSYLNDFAQKNIKNEDKIRPLILDGWLPLSLINVKTAKELGALEPYGVGHPRPRWLVGPVQVKYVKKIGKDPSQGHARIQVVQGRTECWCTAFGFALPFEKLLDTGVDVFLAIEAKLGFWSGRETCEARVIDYAPAL